MKNEYDALNRATVRPEEYAPVPLGEAQQAAQCSVLKPLRKKDILQTNRG